MFLWFNYWLPFSGQCIIKLNAELKISLVKLEQLYQHEFQQKWRIVSQALVEQFSKAIWTSLPTAVILLQFRYELVLDCKLKTENFDSWINVPCMLLVKIHWDFSLDFEIQNDLLSILTEPLLRQKIAGSSVIYTVSSSNCKGITFLIPSTSI